MKTDVDTCLKEIADWYIQNRREITEPELEAILRKHCETEKEVRKFIIFLGTESGKMRFKTLLREKEKPTGFTKGQEAPPMEYMVDDIKVIIRYERPGAHLVTIEPPGGRGITEEEGEKITKLIEEKTSGQRAIDNVAAGQDGFWLGIAGAERKFPLGQIVMTRGVNDLIAENAEFAKFATESLRRHASGDWGDLTEEDKRENEYALGKYLRLFSAYDKYPLPKIWIITEADRSVTTILFPSEY